MYSFKADVAILLNITPTIWTDTIILFKITLTLKCGIVQNQTEQDIFIYWDDDPNIAKELTKRNIISKKYPFSMKKKHTARHLLKITNLKLTQKIPI